MSLIEQYKSEIIETFLIIIAAFACRYLVNKLTSKARIKFQLQKGRIIITRKIINGLIIFSSIILIFIIWGVQRKELAVFFSSFIAILGIALFAQWSMLSNITSSIILFVYHPAKIGDFIVVLDNENPVSGKIKDIGAFFVIIKKENGEIATIPNSLFFQKMIQIKADENE